MQAGIVEERITFVSERLRLAGVLAYPDRAKPERAALVCSPHPHFAGNMDNNVICTIARESAARAVTLRFDYRGIGDSEISLTSGLSVFDYWSDMEQIRDYTDAIQDVSAAASALAEATKGLNIPLSVIGYSFGAATGLLYGHANENVSNTVAIAPPLGKISFDFMSGCSKPSLFLIGNGDFLYSEQETENLRRSLNSCAAIEIVDSADHFFRGDENLVAQKVDQFIRSNVVCSSRRTSDAI